MRKLFIGILAIMFLVTMSTFSFAAPERSCSLMWRAVSGNTFTLTIDEDVYKVKFTAGTHGPCPTGDLELYSPDVLIPDCFIDGEPNEECYTPGELIGICEYKTSDKFVYVSCDDWFNTLTFVFCGDQLILVDPSLLTLQILPEND